MRKLARFLPLPSGQGRGEGCLMALVCSLTLTLSQRERAPDGHVFPLYWRPSRLPEGGLLIGMGDLQEEPIFKGSCRQL
jgi:hypothetical protein